MMKYYVINHGDLTYSLVDETTLGEYKDLSVREFETFPKAKAYLLYCLRNDKMDIQCEIDRVRSMKKSDV